ncbi:HPF/RaiA family ribosome-associated protein [Allomuricauda sp. SCSIO 65647]|uniref:HPF/RaiA family ribosome-associated protein n=1 Tax=Allomuricauda sp. SCSIO 65647 TaxID=2908843 RepID=UPI001F39A2AB|nr:HPF/RaiA family ribosome-associated protein [Muricauda sp. SCSIO 65647]UJH67389.1 HPF/RaiA family ribosome-associated protein [Muricauda sp. SCSIO 65647]
MDIIFEYDNVKSSTRLEELATEKLNKLGEKYEFIVRASIFFRTENSSSSETGKICGIRISVPGPQLFAQSNSESFESSLKKTLQELEHQLAKKKTKLKAHR